MTKVTHPGDIYHMLGKLGRIGVRAAAGVSRISTGQLRRGESPG